MGVLPWAHVGAGLSARETVLAGMRWDTSVLLTGAVHGVPSRRRVFIKCFGQRGIMECLARTNHSLNRVCGRCAAQGESPCQVF
jgi:hypothetical protein